MQKNHFNLHNQLIQSPVLNQLNHNNSDRYKILTTRESLKPFIDHGFTINSVQTKRRGDLSKGAHLVRLSRKDLIVGDNRIELLVSNSYDGSLPFSINLGIFRFICSNGLIVGDSIFKAKIKHVGNMFYEQVEHFIAAALSNIIKAKGAIEVMQAKELSEDEVAEFAYKIFRQRLGSNVIDIDLIRSMRRFRLADSGNSVWQVMNVVQERVMRGSIIYLSSKEVKDNSGKVLDVELIERNSGTLNNVKRIIELNKSIFDAAIKLAG